MNISYDAYRVFYYVAKYRNLTMAADALLSNQPNVSRTVKNLEHALGCTLLIRSNRGVTLTPEGERLYQHVRIAVEQLEAGESAVSAAQRLQSGVVSVGATEVALHCCLLPVLSEFRRQYPGIRLRIANFSTPAALSALRSGAVDFAAVTLPAGYKAQQGLALRTLVTVTETAVAGGSLPVPADQALTPQQLTDYPLVSLGQQTQTFAAYAEWFLRFGVRFSPEIEAATADQILPMVRSGLGIGFVPAQFLTQESDCAGITPLRLTEPLPEFSVCYARAIGHPLPAAARALERMLLAV